MGAWEPLSTITPFRRIQASMICTRRTIMSIKPRLFLSLSLHRNPPPRFDRGDISQSVFLMYSLRLEVLVCIMTGFGCPPPPLTSISPTNPWSPPPCLPGASRRRAIKYEPSKPKGASVSVSPLLGHCLYPFLLGSSTFLRGNQSKVHLARCCSRPGLLVQKVDYVLACYNLQQGGEFVCWLGNHQISLTPSIFDLHCCWLGKRDSSFGGGVSRVPSEHMGSPESTYYWRYFIVQSSHPYL